LAVQHRYIRGTWHKRLFTKNQNPKKALYFSHMFMSLTEA
jgi:hypothetical protein